MTTSTATTTTRRDGHRGWRAGRAGRGRRRPVTQESATRLAQAGPNRLPEARGPSLPRQFAAQMPQLGWAIIAVVIVNGVFSFVQEYRAERATRALAAGAAVR